MCDVDVDCACERWMWIGVWSWRTPPTPPRTNATTHHPTTTPTSTPNTNTTPHQLHPPHDKKIAWSSPLFPVEAKPPTRQPCSCENRLVVRALVEWMSWMVGEETGLSSPRRLRRPAAHCGMTAAKIWVRLAPHHLGVCAPGWWALCLTTTPPSPYSTRQ